MTRTVESPRGGATLSIERASAGVVFVDAANVVGTVRVGLRLIDLLAAIADECGVIVVDRSDLQPIDLTSDGQPWAGGWTSDTSANARVVATAHLALAEHLDTHPPVDEQQVRDLADVITAVESEHGYSTPDLARRLVARGVRVGGEGRG